jgi:RNA polymerase sigma-70 factor (ECF subfamily)
LALSFSRNEDDAKDIYQEVFIRAFRALPEFKEQSDLMTWLHRITTNVCLSFLSDKERRRSASIEEFLDERANSDSPDERQDILSALTTLSSQQRLTFLLKYEEGYKIKEIALMLNCTEGTVKRHLFDATRKLKKF